MMFEVFAAFGAALIVTAAVGKPMIEYLRQMKYGQKILEIGPKWHMAKQYTPTMGGFMFIIGIGAAIAATGIPAVSRGDYRHLAVYLFALAFAAIGFVDDYTKVRKKRNMGLTAMQKLVLQISAAVLFLTILRTWGYLTPNLYIPFVNVTWPIPWYGFMPFAAFVIVGTVNAVNLTDGVDGLAAGVTLPVALFFTFVSVLWRMKGLSLFAAALAGGLVGFLFYNFNPAKVFMGDTGSLFLGGAVCGMAFACDMPVILVLVGIIYIAETLSDIIQVAYFKATHGKRFFKMAPLHHHFEMCGWGEKKIVTVFTAITAAACLLAYAGVKGRYIF